MIQPTQLPIRGDMAVPTAHISFVVPEENLPPLLGTNYFQIAASGPEVELLVGSFDIHHLALALGRAREQAKTGHGGVPLQVTPEISHRFLLSVRAFLMLREKIEEITTALQKSGAIPADIPKVQL